MREEKDDEGERGTFAKPKISRVSARPSPSLNTRGVLEKWKKLRSCCLPRRRRLRAGRLSRSYAAPVMSSAVSASRARSELPMPSASDAGDDTTYATPAWPLSAPGPVSQCIWARWQLVGVRAVEKRRV